MTRTGALALAFGFVLLAPASARGQAHKGQYRGPVDELRNASRAQGNPRLGPTPRAPGDGESPAGAVPRRRVPVGFDGEGFKRWEFWWEYNKDLYLQVWNLRNREMTDVIYGSPDFYLGRRSRRDVASLEPISAEARKRLIAPLLLDALKDTDASVRAAALVALGKVKEGVTVDTFRAFLSDSAEAVRESAYIGIGLFGDIQAVPHLLRVLEGSDVDVGARIDAAIALGLLGRPEVTPYLIDFLRRNLGNVENRAEDVNLAVIDAIGISGDRSAVPFLVDLARAGNLRSDKLGCFVLLALGRLKDRLALPLLIKELSAKDIDSRRAAALALGEIDYYSSDEIEVASLLARKATWTERDSLTREALDELDQLIREKQAASDKEKKELRRLRDIAARALAHVIREDNDNQARNYAAVSLGKVAGSASRDALVWALDTGYSRSLQSFAAIGLGLLGDPSVSPLLLRKLALYGEESLRGAVAVALGLLREPAAVEPLLQVVSNRGGDRDFRGYAAIALGLMGARESLPLVQKTLEEEGDDKDIGRGFSIALGLLGDRSSVPALMAVIVRKQNLDEARGAATLALGLQRDTSGMKPLGALLKSGTASAEVRSFAAAALGYLGDTERIPGLSRLARNHDYRIYVAPLEDLFKVM